MLGCGGFGSLISQLQANAGFRQRNNATTAGAKALVILSTEIFDVPVLFQCPEQARPGMCSFIEKFISDRMIQTHLLLRLVSINLSIASWLTESSNGGTYAASAAQKACLNADNMMTSYYFCLCIG